MKPTGNELDLLEALSKRKSYRYSKMWIITEKAYPQQIKDMLRKGWIDYDSRGYVGVTRKGQEVFDKYHY